MTDKMKTVFGIATFALLASSPAFAHPGHGIAMAFTGGFMHPFTGWDHMLAMAALGLWLGGTRSIHAVPALLTTVAALVAGFVLGVVGFNVPMVEAGILASVFVFGLLGVSFTRLPAAFAAPLVAAFMLCHGHAHGVEMTGNAVLFGLGFVSASTLIVAAVYSVVRLAVIRRAARVQ